MRCRRLSEVAKVGDVLEAQSVLQEMVSQGHGLSAEAYHGLIFSYMKAGDSTAALNALYAALDSSSENFWLLNSLTENGRRKAHSRHCSK